MSHSWDVIRQTAGVTDTMLNQRFRRTALLAVLQAHIRDDGYSFPVLTPEKSLQIPTADEITSRWPGMSQEQVAAIQEDYMQESDKLERLRLEDVIERVRELAAQEQGWS
jgi:nuclear pore complex protein Nup133